MALIADAIKDCTAHADIVLDPFLGSGTTVIAAERNGRVCHGLELDPGYVDVVIRRWQKHTGLDAVLIGNGETFQAREALAVKEAIIMGTPVPSNALSLQQEGGLEHESGRRLSGRLRKAAKSKSV